MMMADINELEGKMVFPVRIVALALILVIGAGIFIFFVMDLESFHAGILLKEFLLMIAIVIFLLSAPFILISFIDRYFHQKDGIIFGIRDVIRTLFLTFAGFISLVYLQDRLNILIRQSGRSGDAASK